MPLAYPEANLVEARRLISEQKTTKAGLHSLLAKVRNGYFTNKEVVLNSGLTKTEVKKLLDGYDQTVRSNATLQHLQTQHDSAVDAAYRTRKVALDRELADLEKERRDAKALFPTDAALLVGHGPGEMLRAAYGEMH
jgi:hypothetical protein